MSTLLIPDPLVLSE